MQWCNIQHIVKNKYGKSIQIILCHFYRVTLHLRHFFIIIIIIIIIII